MKNSNFISSPDPKDLKPSKREKALLRSLAEWNETSINTIVIESTIKTDDYGAKMREKVEERKRKLRKPGFWKNLWDSLKTR